MKVAAHDPNTVFRREYWTHALADVLEREDPENGYRFAKEAVWSLSEGMVFNEKLFRKGKRLIEKVIYGTKTSPLPRGMSDQYALAIANLLSTRELMARTGYVAPRER